MKIFDLKKITMLFAIVFAALTLKAQSPDTSYNRIAKDRADKIISALNIQDKNKEERASRLIAKQYETLNQLHSKRDSDIKAAGGDTAKVKRIKLETDAAVRKLHASYLSSLATELTAAQIEGVKNGMTYNTVPLTYANYLLMLPYLTLEQQDRVKGYLTEAREFAIDGGTAKEKQQWFGRYKGRIANYLSGLGYNLKKEGDDWAKRRDTASKALPIQRSNMVMRVLKLDSGAKSNRESVRNLVALHYQTVEELTAAWMAGTVKKDSLISKEIRDKADNEAWLAMRKELAKKRDAFLDKLNLFLSTSQIDTVKSAMTNNGLNNEYNHYLSLFPELKATEKTQVHAYLSEAQENAINVLTNREVKQWFAKFRGRANNYLAKQGYNLRKATEDWEKKYGRKSPF